MSVSIYKSGAVWLAKADGRIIAATRTSEARLREIMGRAVIVHERKLAQASAKSTK